MNSFLFNFSEVFVSFLLPFLIGGLVFFAALVAPNTFKNLDSQHKLEEIPPFSVKGKRHKILAFKVNS